MPSGAEPTFDLTSLLHRSGVDAHRMVEIGERFYTSMGFAPLPETFWTRSQLVPNLSA